MTDFIIENQGAVILFVGWMLTALVMTLTEKQ